MIKVLPRNLLRFIIVILLQVVVFNNLLLGDMLNPFFYVIFILLLPFETPIWLLLLIGFITGFTVDCFTFTYGMHAAAAVFMAFLRPYVLSVIAPRDGYEPGTFPRLFYYGFGWFFKYTIILVLAHHLFYFYFEVFRLDEFFITLTRVILSTLLSTSIIIISQYIIFRK